MKKIISTILVVTTLLSCLAVLPFGAWAERLGNGDVLETIDPKLEESAIKSYLAESYFSAQDKIDRDTEMKLVATYKNMELYANAITGEVYVKDTTTGNILHSNPYDKTGFEGVDSAYAALTMSQVTLTYKGVGVTDVTESTYNSFKDAAVYGQITLDRLENGIRVNYTLGNARKRFILPYSIMATDMIENIFAPMQEVIAAEMKAAALENGISEEEANKHFDYEVFYEKEKKTYSTEKVFGKEYIYGNFSAFVKWHQSIKTRYENHFYKTPMADRVNMMAPTEFSDIAQNFFMIYNNYVFCSAYEYDSVKNTFATKGDDPANWTTSVYVNQEIYDVLLKKDTHEILGKEYYCNNFFSVNPLLSDNVMKRIEDVFGGLEGGYTLGRATAAEEAAGIGPTESDKPVFNLSIEYKLTDDGVTAEIPAGSIMYDESRYKVTKIMMLPYMGTANIYGEGYLFYPDGSGALVDYALARSESFSLKGKIYGQDYAKYVIDGMYTKNISMPVYGNVYESNTYVVDTPFGVFPINRDQYEDKDFVIEYKEERGKVYAILPFGRRVETTVYYTIEDGFYKSLNINITDENDAHYYSKVKTELRPKDFKLETKTNAGYLAIVEEGASLSTIETSFNGENVRMTSQGISFAPRVEDTYEFKAGAEYLEFTVQAKNKYTGSYALRFVMLTDDKVAQEKGITDYYQSSYAGMADAYQEYLVDNKLLPESADISDQLPLIIESFGVMQTKEKFLSIPFTVDAALTTFDDVETMYEEMAARGIQNIKFRLTGFTNGGMNATYPVKVKWEGEAGGKSGFKDLLEYASEETRKNAGLEIYPNFEFLYVTKNGGADGINLKKIGARSADNRYAVRKAYTSFYQGYTRDPADGILVTASKLEDLFAKFNKKYKKYDNKALSLSSVSSDLSGDFDEENGITREETADYISSMLDTALETYGSIMSDGGNLYTLKYMSYLVNAPLDSSHYKRATRTVPFWSMVVHGHIQYAGTPFNENANKDEALLRAIESGANLYFTLSYDNTNLLKDDTSLNKYYAVNYQISKDTVSVYYNKLDAVIGDLQDAKIVDHALVKAERVNIASDIAVQTKELEDEFLAKLAEQVVAEQEALREIILKLRSQVAKIDINAQRAKYDVDRNGYLSEAEIEACWNGYKVSDRDDFVKEFVAKYYANPYIASIIGGLDLNIDNETNRKAQQTVAGKRLFSAILNGELDTNFGQTIGVVYDEKAVIASAYKMLGVEVLSEEFLAKIRAYMDETASDVNATSMQVKIGDVSYTPAHSYFTTSNFDDEMYRATESTVSNGTVVMVTYQKGDEKVRIILNYNVFAVNVRIDGIGTVRLEKYGYMRLN